MNSQNSQTISALIIKAAIFVAIALTVISTFFLIGYILIEGIPHLAPNLFAIKYTSDNVSMLPAIINTLFMVVGSLVLAVPVGVFAAIFLTLYARSKSKIVQVIELASQTLTGIPSIVYGLFGMLLFVNYFHWGFSLIAGVFTLAIMILPVIIRTSQESLLAVDKSYRDASYGLGASKLRTIFLIILPAAFEGILAGILLSVGRVVGESAALIFTAGTVAQIASNMFLSSRSLAVHMYVLSSEGLHLAQAYATAVVLLLIALILNIISVIIKKRVEIK